MRHQRKIINTILRRADINQYTYKKKKKKQKRGIHPKSTILSTGRHSLPTVTHVHTLRNGPQAYVRKYNLAQITG